MSLRSPGCKSLGLKTKGQDPSAGGCLFSAQRSSYSIEYMH